MTQHSSSNSVNQPTRRAFLGQSAAAGAALAATLSVPAVHAAGSDVIRVGLIGCGSPRGGRGRGAAENCLRADSNIKLHAMADLFPDHLQFTREYLQKHLGDRVDSPAERCFTGWDAYKQLLALKEIDLVILSTPPGFRPLHLQAAVDAGKHIFCEKPVAVDGPGVRRVLDAVQEAKQKKLSLVSGLCWRYDTGVRELMKHLHGGAIGEITAIQTTYNTHGLWHIKREPSMSDVEWQCRNWLYFTWLSGDFNVEQHIHSLDKTAWAMKDEYPARCYGVGGRQVRTSEEFGHIYDHHSVVYEYPSGVKIFSQCRQQDNCAPDVSDHFFGTRGFADTVGGGDTASVRTRELSWQFSRDDRKKADSMYQIEHNELVASIRAGKPINNGDYMAKSTLMAIMGRMATYTGQVVTWEKALHSQENLSPSQYAFGDLPVPPVAMPGKTKLV